MRRRGAERKKNYIKVASSFYGRFYTGFRVTGADKERTEFTGRRAFRCKYGDREIYNQLFQCTYTVVIICPGLSGMLFS